MATPILMPSFGMYTAEGTVVNWLHPDGTRVGQGEPVLEIETEKAVNQVLAPGSGFLRQQVIVGTLVKEEGLLGYILSEQERGSFRPGAAVPAPSGEAKVAETEVTSMGSVSEHSAIKASPIARKLAAEHGIDLPGIQGSGPGGRVVESDVIRVISRSGRLPTAAEASQAGALQPATTTTGKRIPFSKLRKAIGERLRRSVSTAAAVTLTREVEVEHLIAARRTLADKLGAPVPYEAFFMKLLAAGLARLPELKSTVEDDHLVLADEIDIGFAVAVSGGLHVPVVRNVDRAPVAAIAEEIRRLGQKARENALAPGDITGGISTVTNLGRYGVDAFTPILNPPQSSILGIGRIAPRPVVRDGALAAAQTCWLSLTFDHRVTDGVPAAQVLDSVAEAIRDSDRLSSILNL